MAYFSRSYYSGDGTTKDFPVDFPYLDRAHIQVFLNGVLTTAWTWIDASHIRITTAPGAGVVVLIKRATSPAARLVDYVSPSSLNEDDLDNDSLQGFYLAQEANDQANAGVGDDPATGQFTAAGKRITNVADPVNDQDAATKNWVVTALNSPVAQAIAKAAEAAASAAAALASQIAAAASAALAGTKATEASNSATTAAGHVTTALGHANAAAGSATSASTSAGTATTKAGEASASATAAAGSAGTAAGHVTTAAGHATTATTKAGEAAASATAANNAKLAAEAAAGSMTPVQDQINAATDEAFADTAMLPARKVDGSLIKRSWANVKEAIRAALGSMVSASSAKTTPVDADQLLLSDSAASNGPAKLSWLNVKATLKTYFDGLYLLAANVTTAVQYRAATAGKVLTADTVWASATWVNLGGALTGNLSLDFNTFLNGYGTLSGNVTLNAFTNGGKTASYLLSLWNPSTYTLSLNTTYFKTSGSGITLATGRNLLSLVLDADGKYVVTLIHKGLA